jgi:uncharacterized membrane protein YoaK (UPF0700 family)
MTTAAHSGSERVDAALLSFVAAFVDTACFIGLFGLFTAHVTGNFVLIGAALVSRNAAVVAKLLALPVFIVAVLATAETARWLHARQRACATPLLAVQGLLLLGALAAALLLPQAVQADDLTSLVTGMLAVAAMGVQNALMRIDLASLPPTTVMTGNVTQVTIDALTTRSAAADTKEGGEARQRIARMWPGIVAFTLGAACAAGAFALAGLLSLSLPAALCFLLAWRFRGR